MPPETWRGPQRGGRRRAARGRGARRPASPAGRATVPRGSPSCDVARRCVRHGSRRGSWKATAQRWSTSATGVPSSSTTPGIRVIEPRHQPQQGGLAASGRPEQRDDLAGADRESMSRSTTCSVPSGRVKRLPTPRTATGSARGVSRREGHAPESTDGGHRATKLRVGAMSASPLRAPGARRRRQGHAIQRRAERRRADAQEAGGQGHLCTVRKLCSGREPGRNPVQHISPSRGRSRRAGR